MLNYVALLWKRLKVSSQQGTYLFALGKKNFLSVTDRAYVRTKSLLQALISLMMCRAIRRHTPSIAAKDTPGNDALSICLCVAGGRTPLR